MARSAQALISDCKVAAYRIPTDEPEADGTYAWNSTTIIVVQLSCGDETGLGYTYADASAAALIETLASKVLKDRDSFDIPARRLALLRAVRNLGRSGLAACAVSALDCALWDLKAKLLGVALATLLGRCRNSVPIYGSGGFTTYSNDRLKDQLSAWVERDGCRFVKMKIGTHPEDDPARALAAKSAIGGAELFVDGNGAFSVKQALRFVEASAEADIRWFEEPVTSDDPGGLALMRERTPPGMAVAAGEYVFDLDDARILLEANAVDVLQADVTRCGGVSAFLEVGALCEAHHIDLSGHCAPSLHAHVACAVQRLRHLEWFHDHVRIEHMLFDGGPDPCDGAIAPDLSRPGLGLELKAKDAERFRVGGGP
jgi:L-alanine-DL-glutamate epimerase-like enolase superfamily enzyme